jgi:signal transduction histidine kinase
VLIAYSDLVQKAQVLEYNKSRMMMDLATFERSRVQLNLQQIEINLNIMYELIVRLKATISNIDHELIQPISDIQSKIKNILDINMSTDNYLKNINEFMTRLDDLTHQIKSVYQKMIKEM